MLFHRCFWVIEVAANQHFERLLTMLERRSSHANDDLVSRRFFRLHRLRHHHPLRVHSHQ
jgi:hypothetical protein